MRASGLARGAIRVPREMMTGKPAMLLQLLLRAAQRSAVHDGMEGVPQFGARLQRPEFAFLGSQPARVRRLGLGVGLGSQFGAILGFHRVELAQQLAPLLQRCLAGFEPVDLGADFARPHRQLDALFHLLNSPVCPLR